MFRCYRMNNLRNMVPRQAELLSAPKARLFLASPQAPAPSMIRNQLNSLNRIPRNRNKYLRSKHNLNGSIRARNIRSCILNFLYMIGRFLLRQVCRLRNRLGNNNMTLTRYRNDYRRKKKMMNGKCCARNNQHSHHCWSRIRHWLFLQARRRRNRRNKMSKSRHDRNDYRRSKPLTTGKRPKRNNRRRIQ